MEPKTILTALIGYGKGPAIRYAVVALAWAYTGQSGFDSVKANNFAQAAWELALPLLVTAVCWIVGTFKRKTLADAEPPTSK